MSKLSHFVYGKGSSLELKQIRQIVPRDELHYQKVPWLIVVIKEVSNTWEMRMLKSVQEAGFALECLFCVGSITGYQHLLDRNKLLCAGVESFVDDPHATFDHGVLDTVVIVDQCIWF
jgi:hypothetical protein